MEKEGQVRIPAGCAIAAVISKEGKKMTGEMITEAMKPMHERSNGLGGGFAGYGIPMQPDRDTMEKISLFPDHIKPMFLHLRHPPHLLDEKIRAFDCSAKKKAAEAASNNRHFHHEPGISLTNLSRRMENCSALSFPFTKPSTAAYASL